MVSVQAALSPCADLVFLTKKRKRGDGEDHAEALFAEETKPVKAEEKEEEIELNLDAPLPLDWQRCLDIKVKHLWRICDVSLLIYDNIIFYYMKTKKIVV